MISVLKKLFSGVDLATDNQNSELSPEIALATLLVEVMLADHEKSEHELDTIKTILGRHFELSSEMIEKVISQALKQADNATDYYQFTRVINENYDIDIKINIVNYLWQIARADGNIDVIEEHVIRRIADLLHLRHSEYIKAKENKC